SRRQRRRAAAHAADEALDVAAFDADLAQQLVDERRLRAIAQRRVDEPVGEAARVRAVAATAIAAAAEAVDVEDLDALDPLHRPHRLADDRLGLLDQPHAQGGGARLGREHVVRVVHHPRRFGLDLSAHAHRHRADLLGVGVGLGLGADRGAAVDAGLLLGARRARQPERLALCRLARPDQLDRLLALGHLDLARGEDLLLGGDRVGARRVGRRLGDALRLALLGDRDRALLLGELERHPPFDLGGLDRALLGDPLLLDRLLGANARSVDRLLGGDLRAFALLLALRAYSPSRSISSESFSASRFLLRIAIRVSCSTSFRCFLRCSLVSVRRVRPSASNALLGLKNSIEVWSSCVSDTDSSSRPFFVRSSAAASRTRRTYAPRFSWSSSIVISAAAVRSASTNLPSTSSFSCSGSIVRRPSVCAAAATASGRAATRT